MAKVKAKTNQSIKQTKIPQQWKTIYIISGAILNNFEMKQSVIAV